MALEVRWGPAEEARARVAHERDRQDGKWGEQNHHCERWMTILTEEVGEAAQAALERSRADFQRELSHVAAVAVAALEQLERETDLVHGHPRPSGCS